MLSLHHNNMRQVLDLKLKKQGLSATDEAKDVAIKISARKRDRPNFGNAGAVENLILRTKGQHKRRSQNDIPNFDPDAIFLPQDFDEKHVRGSGPKPAVESSLQIQWVVKDSSACYNIAS